jgi:hypothetical protein
MNMILFYPLIIISHSSIFYQFPHSGYIVVFKEKTPIIKEVETNINYSALKVKLAMVDVKKGYISRTGYHEVLPYNIEPIFTSTKFDLYAFEMLYDVIYRKKRFKEPEELFDEAYNMYISNTENPLAKVSAFLKRVKKGWYRAIIIRPVSLDEFLDEAERFTLTYFFDIAPKL